MATLEGFRVRNFGVLKDVTLGRLWDRRREEALTPMTAVIGKNGVGKSALFDAFGFLADALNLNNVEEACDARGRGVLKKCDHKAQQTPSSLMCTIENTEMPDRLPIKLPLRQTNSDVPTSCENAFDKDARDRKGVGLSLFYFSINNGSGVAWKGDQAGHQIDEAIDNLQSLMTFLESIKSEESGETETIELNDPRKLGIASRILSMPWNRKKFGSSKKTKMGFPKYVEQMKIHL